MNQYKIILSNYKFYKEIELPKDTSKVLLGTDKNCHIRINRDYFFHDVELELTYDGEDWSIQCGESVYFSQDGVLKLIAKTLAHGDDIYVKYADSNQELFKLSFVLNFDWQSKNFEKVIAISDPDQITIGSTQECNFQIMDPLFQQGKIVLYCQNSTYHLEDQGTRYGVYVNGIPMKGRVQLKEQDFFSVLGYHFYIKNGRLYTSKDSGILTHGITAELTNNHTSSFVYPLFNRNTRIKSIIPNEEITILDPPSLGEKPKSNILTSLIPAFLMITVSVVARKFIGGNSSYIILSVAMMSVGVFTSVFNLVNNGRDYRKKVKERRIKYLKYIENKKEEIAIARNQEKDVLNRIYYSMGQLAEMVNGFSGNIFDRSPSDMDFLHVRIGIGTILANRKIDVKSPEHFETSDDLIPLPVKCKEEFSEIKHAPVILPLLEMNALGIVGNILERLQLLKNITLDLAVRHYYDDLRMFYFVDANHIEFIEGLRFLPHMQNHEYPFRNVVCNDESRNWIFEYLYKELSSRETQKRKAPYFVIFVFDEMEFKQHPISKFLPKAKELGVTFLFFEQEKDQLPLCCDEIIDLDHGVNRGYLYKSEDSNKVTEFTYESLENEIYDKVARKLAPVFCEEVSLAGSLTKNITLFQLLEIYTVEDLDIGYRWRTAQVAKTMAAPLGVNAKSEPVFLDLHEKYHGPHGLVAGTTGSGKSEILQSYILSMATMYHPYEVGFVIIDFKGGGMVNQFRNLPHLIGAITNIDDGEIQRSLLSIRAELKKRQTIFAKYEVNHIDKYIEKFREGVAKEALPHLIVIVDEFAELKAEQPDFMKELISTARIGRSLGVHLILATQKPAGVVNDQIWSNSKFKLCLKVQTKEDSNEMLKSPLAAEIKEPGRAYLQVGNNEIFELFQSAYSGGAISSGEEEAGKEIEIFQVETSGKRNLIFQKKVDGSSVKSITQLDAVVEYVRNYCEKNNVSKLPEICLPPLEDIIDFPEECEFLEENGIVSTILGYYDDPNHQYQGEIRLNLTSENTIIIGSTQFGKTNILQSIIKYTTERYSPKELEIYVLDFGSMILKLFDNLNHVGGVICSGDDEKLKNFVKLIITELESRKEKLATFGVTSFASYLEAGQNDLTQIVIMIDNLTALRELYFQEDEVLLKMFREGLSVGISFVIANGQTSGIGYRYLSNFSYRIALFCNDKGEYTNLFESNKLNIKETPGRSLIKKDKMIYQAQMFRAFSGEKEIERAESMKSFIENTNQKYHGLFAREIPEIPKILTNNFLYHKYEKFLLHTKGKDGKVTFQNMFEQAQILVGIDYDTVTPFVLDLREINFFGISGQPKFGKGNFVKNIISHFESVYDSMKTQLYVIDDMHKKFQFVEASKLKMSYTVDGTAIHNILAEIDEKLSERYERMSSGTEELLPEDFILLCIQNPAVAEEIENNLTTEEIYKRIVNKYKSLGISIIFTNVDNSPINYSSPAPLKMIKDSEKMILFSDMANIKVIEMSYGHTKQYKKSLEVGDMYILSGSNLNKVKTALHTGTALTKS